VLQRDPANTFVAGFLGHPPMNLFTGGVVEGSHLYLEQLAIPLPETAQVWAHTGRNVTLGVHAEDIHLITETSPQPEGIHLRSTVEVIEPDFSHHTQLAHLRTGRFNYTAVIGLDISLKVGDEVEVILPTAQLYFFDRKTERRIG
jgi:multiple sugar transport system ATP-binding protein